MTAIEASCPGCGELNAIPMSLKEADDELQDIMTAFLAGLTGSSLDAKSYAFTGDGKCKKCGEKIHISLNVYGSGMNEKIKAARAQEGL